MEALEEKKKRPRKVINGVTIKGVDYDGYNIDSIFTNEKNNAIYFKDSTKAHLPCFVLDFKNQNLMMDDGDMPKPYIIRKIRTGMNEIVSVAKKNKAPFWITSYLDMITDRTSRRMYMFYNAFVSGNEVIAHSSIRNLMGPAEFFAKAGFRISISREYSYYYKPTLDTLEKFKKAIPVIRKTTDFWTDPYSTEYEFHTIKKNNISDVISLYETQTNATVVTFMEVAEKYNFTLDSIFAPGYYSRALLENLEYLNKTCGYDIKRTAKYLLNDVDYQGMNTREVYVNAGLLKDYAKMSFEVLGNTKFTKYPSYLKTYHDIAQRNYRVKEDEILNNKFVAVKTDTQERLTKLDINHKKFTVLVPESMKDIITEGARQHHCVASYAKTMVNRETTILFMRLKEDPEEALITVEVRNLFSNGNKPFIAQARGHSNRSLNEEEFEFLTSWAKKNEISYGRD